MDEDNKYERLAAFFDDRSSSKPGSGFDGEAERELLKKTIYYWDKTSGNEIDPATIIQKTKEKQRLYLKRKKQIFLYKVLGAAGCVILLVVGAYKFYPTGNNGHNLVSMSQSMDENMLDSQETILITTKEELLIKQDGFIQYDHKGALNVDSDEINSKEVKPEAAKEKSNQPEYNQLFVPKGKRAKVQLSDGSILRVNSNSKVIYPNHFAAATRKIFVEGEVYLEVTHDASKPFIVQANDFELTVLGTKFNICNYKEAAASNIVLVEGAVEIKDANKDKVKMAPDELVTIKSGSFAEKTKVDTELYTSWIDGILILRGEPLSDVIRRLSLYYNTEIECESAIKDKKVYGKLDLKDNLMDILESIQGAVTFQILEENNKVYLTA